MKKLSLVIPSIVVSIFTANSPLYSANIEDASANNTTIEEGAPLQWQQWSPEKVEELLKAGTPVYVDFTADWCLTCQHNKSKAYDKTVRKLFKEKGIVLLQADMTAKNPQAAKALKGLKRSSVPTNVLYLPGDKTPHLTQQMLSPSYLTEFVKKLMNN